MMDFNAMAYCLGIWFVGHDDRLPVQQRSDWMATWYREQRDGDWHMLYRFRYHHSALPFDTEDIKNWYHGTMPHGSMPEAMIIEKMRVFTAALGIKNHCAPAEVLVRDTGDVAMERLMQQPWCFAAVKKGPSDGAAYDGVL